MIFADDMNSYFGGPQHNSASTNPLDMPGAPWKPPGAGHSADLIPGSGYNDGSGSKLVTKWGHPMPVDYQKNGGHHESQQVLNQQAAPFTPGLHHGAQPGFPTWNEPSFQFTHQPPQQDQHLQQTEAKFSGLNLKANVFHPSMPPQQVPPGHFTPPVEMVNGQWGRAEINQTTPWNLEMNGISANESTPSQQQPQQRYRKWEQQPRDVDGPFNPGGYPGPAPYGMHGYGSGNDRIMPGGGGAFAPPQFAPPNRVPPQRWDGGMGGPPSGKFGGGDMGGAGVNMMQQQRGSGGPTGLFTSGPPPPLHSMGMPPRPGHILGGHMPPPPLLPSLNPHTMSGAQFNNQFVQMDIQPSNLSEDSVWQDPNGDLRKWQKDTGTSIWGDPAKQTNVPIQRWLQFTADEVVAKSSILSKDGEIVDGGWGDLPPIGANAALANNSSSNTGNPNSNSGARSGGGNQFIMPHHSQSSSQPQPQQHPNKNNRQIGSNSNSNSWGQENQITGAQAWERHEQQQQNIPMHQQNMNPMANSSSQFQPPSGAMSTGSTAGNFMLPPTTTAAQSQQQPSMFQPPSLLSSLIDPMTGTSETDHHQQGGQGGQRKAASPPGQSSSTMGLGPPAQQVAQQTKVSLAEELSSLGGTHGLGGPIW